MKQYYKTITLALFTVALMIGAPCIKTSCNCGLTIPLAFTGAILGCGGEKNAAQQTDVNDKSVAVVEEKKSVESEKEGELKVTFVELGSVNCIPCRMMQPVMQEVEKKYTGQVKVVFHDVWTPEGRESGVKYAIRVIPTQVFLDSNGKEYFRHEGFFPFEDVDKILKQKGVK